jgi:DNA-binding NarL/FixJ family response regulator
MIRIILLDDHAVVRSGYHRLLDAEPDMYVVGEAATAEEANALVASTKPDVALVDLSLKGSSGIEAIRGMLSRRAHLKILVLSMHDSPGHVMQSLRSGATGYMTKFSDPSDVIDGIRRVALGERVFSREVSEVLAREALGTAEPLMQLTPREYEVLRLAVNGEPTLEIARSMHLSPKTIYNYLSIIRQKLNVQSDFQLLQIATEHGMVEAMRTT